MHYEEWLICSTWGMWAKRWQWMNGMEKSQQKLKRVAPIVACIRWNQWNIGSSDVLLLNKSSGMLLALCGDLLHKKSNSWCSEVLFNDAMTLRSTSLQDTETIQPHLVLLKKKNRPFVDYLVPTEWSSFQCFAMTRSERRQAIWDTLHDHGRIEWQQTLSNLKKSFRWRLQRCP